MLDVANSHAAFRPLPKGVDAVIEAIDKTKKD
jgi:hypothetical protein